MPKAARLNDDIQEQLDGIYQRRFDNAFAWSRAISMFQMLPGLRGLWPMSSFNENGNAYDLSGQGRILTNNNVVYTNTSLTPRAAFVAGSTSYLTRADEAGLDIIGTEAYVTAALQGLTLGGWFFPAANVTNEGLMSKFYATGNQRSYLLRKTAANTCYFAVSVDGTALTVVNVTSIVIDQWQFIVGRFDPSTELATFVNSVKAVNTTAIPATIFNSTEAFDIGRYDRTNYFTGSVFMGFLCATALPDAMIQSLYQLTRPLFAIR